MKLTRALIVSALMSTLTLVAADVKNGKVVYDRSCKSCHGADGTPNPAIAKMFKVDMRSLSSTEVQQESDDEMKKIITEGKGKMHPVKTVSGASLDDVVAYVRTLNK